MKTKIIDSRLLDVHDSLSAQFWVDHNVEKCERCQEALTRSQC